MKETPHDLCSSNMFKTMIIASSSGHWGLQSVWFCDLSVFSLFYFLSDPDFNNYLDSGVPQFFSPSFS